MDSIRVGRAVRALRIRRRWRQLDLAAAAGVSRQLIAKIESGQFADTQLATVETVTAALGATFDIGIRWRGEGLDRLLDAAHAGLVESMVSRLEPRGWEAQVEASFAIAGERGSVDVLALHRATATILVVEVKSVVPDSQATLHALDRKARLAAVIARDRGWPCRQVGRLLVIGASSAARARVDLLASTCRSAFPVRGRAIERWIRAPDGPISGLLFLPFATRGGTTNRVTGRQRVRRPSR